MINAKELRKNLSQGRMKFVEEELTKAADKGVDYVDFNEITNGEFGSFSDAERKEILDSGFKIKEHSSTVIIPRED